MNLDSRFRWSFKSADLGANFAIVVCLFLLGGIALLAGFFILALVLIAIGLARAVSWYINLPISATEPAAQAEQRSADANFPLPEEFLEAHCARLLDIFDEALPSYQVYLAMVRSSNSLYEAETFNIPLPPIPPENTVEEGGYPDRPLNRARKADDPSRVLEVINTTIGIAYSRFAKSLPPLAQTTFDEFTQVDKGPAIATFPLIDLLPCVSDSVVELVAPFFSDEAEAFEVFTGLKRQIDLNVQLASGNDSASPLKKLVMPDSHKGTPREIVSAYLSNTPLEALFYAPIPLHFTDKQRFEHMHIVGDSGHGKTQLLQHLIWNDLIRPSPPSLVVIDSQGEMLRKIQKLHIFAPGQPLADHLIIIDPEDIEYPPALNMFDTGFTCHRTYSQTIREQVEASTIELFNYVFGTLAAELTSRQNATFAFVTRLMLSSPDATIHTLRELFEDGATRLEDSSFADRISALDEASRAFFRNQFFTETYSQTRQQIARRLHGVLRVPAFDRMFASTENRLDLFGAMQNGSVVLINTSKALLKADASALFSRYMIARVIGAAFERVAISPDKRNSAFLIVNEAVEYLDENLETLLSQARKFNVGVLFAHQDLDQLTPALRASVAVNTSIKIAGGVSYEDARSLVPDMQTTPDFIAGMRKHSGSTEFACSIRNLTSNAIRLGIPFGTLEGAPTMTAAQHAQLVATNRLRYTVDRVAPESTAVDPDLPRQGSADQGNLDNWRS
jgi:hypothetical protein